MNEIDTNALKTRVQSALTKSGCLSMEGFYVNKHCPVLDNFQGGTDATKESLATAVSDFAPGIDERSIICLYDAPVSGHLTPVEGKAIIAETGLLPYRRILLQDLRQILRK